MKWPSNRSEQLLVLVRSMLGVAPSSDRHEARGCGLKNGGFIPIRPTRENWVERENKNTMNEIHVCLVSILLSSSTATQQVAY